MKAALRITLISLKVRVRSMTRLGWVLTAVGGILVPALSFTLGKSLAWASPEPHYLLPFLTGTLNFLLLMQLGTAFSAAFYHLYLARDLPLFLVSPVRPRSVILAKLLEVAAAGIGSYVVAGIPLLVSLGVAWYAPPWYYALSILAGFPFALIPAVLAILANLLVCRILPPYRVKEVTAALGTIIGAIAYFFTRMAFSTSGWGNSTGDISEVASVFGRMGPSWSPSALLARAVIVGLFERPVPLVATASTLLLVSIGLFAVVVNRTERAYLSGWMVSRESRTVRAPSATSARRAPKSRADAPGSASTQARRADRFRGSTFASDDRVPPLSMERTSFVVESKLLFRDLQSQSQVLYVLVMVLALTVFPSQSDPDTPSWLSSISPFFFLILAGSYDSWSVKNMPITIRILAHSPANPARVMRGKAFFYGLFQAVCALILFVLVKALIPLAQSGATPALLMIWIALAFSTGATSVCAAVYDAKTVQSTGVPKLGVAAWFTLILVNAVLAGIGIIGFFFTASLITIRPLAGWAWVAVVVGTQIAAFFVATNMAGRRVRAIARAGSGAGNASGAGGGAGDGAGASDGAGAGDGARASDGAGASDGARASDGAGFGYGDIGGAVDGKNRGIGPGRSLNNKSNVRGSGGSGSKSGNVVRALIAFLLALSWVAGSGGIALASTVPASIEELACHEVNGVKVYIGRLPQDQDGASQQSQEQPPEKGLSQIGAVMLTGTANQREHETHCARMAKDVVLMYPRPSGESVWSIAAESYSLGSVMPLRSETGPDYTAFFMAVPEYKTIQALSVFLDSLFRSTLTDDPAFRMEVKRIRRELTELTNREENALINKMMLCMYEGTCYWEDLFGTPVTAVSADKVRAFMEREYTPARLSLVVLSDSDETQILDCVAHCLEGIPPGDGPSNHADVRFNQPETGVLELGRAEQRAGLGVGVSGVSPEDMPAVEALLNIATRRLYTDFRRGTGTKMEASLHRVLMTNSTVVATYGFTARSGDQSIEGLMDQNAALLREILSSLAVSGPNPDELSRFTIPTSSRRQMPVAVASPYSEVEALAFRLIPGSQSEDLLEESGMSAESSPEALQALLKAAAAKYLPDAKVTVVYVRSSPASTWIVLGGALVVLIAVVSWRVVRGRRRNLRD